MVFDESAPPDPTLGEDSSPKARVQLQEDPRHADVCTIVHVLNNNLTPHLRHSPFFPCTCTCILYDYYYLLICVSDVGEVIEKQESRGSESCQQIN